MKKLEFLEGPASQLLEIASHVLAAEIASKQGNHERRARRARAGAGASSTRLKYTEPPPWPLPVRQLQGAELLAAGRAARRPRPCSARTCVEYPENGWALYGLAESLRAQQKDAAEVDKRFAAAWAASDVKLTSPRF